jgi:L-amino acid N-acyltransferase YncA
MMNFDGSIGAVTILPECRKRGFRRMVISSLILRSLDMGLTPYSQIGEEDAESQQLLGSLNFAKTGKIAKIGVDRNNFVESEPINSVS